MRTRTPLTLVALLLTAALTVLTPLSAATEAAPTTAAKKKKKKKALKCKKGFVKKTVKKTVKKQGKKKTVKVKKCVKKKAPAKKPVSMPAPPAPAPRPTLSGSYTGTTSQGQAISVGKSNQGSVSVGTTVVVNCTGGATPGDAAYEVSASAIGKPTDGDFQVTDLSSAPFRPTLRIVVKGTIANGTATGTIDPDSNSQCPDAGTPITFQATKR